MLLVDYADYYESTFLGTCVDNINSFTCICPTGFSGVNCDENIDDCLTSPCANGMQFYVILLSYIGIEVIPKKWWLVFIMKQPK